MNKLFFTAALIGLGTAIASPALAHTCRPMWYEGIWDCTFDGQYVRMDWNIGSSCNYYGTIIDGGNIMLSTPVERSNDNEVFFDYEGPTYLRRLDHAGTRLTGSTSRRLIMCTKR